MIIPRKEIDDLVEVIDPRVDLSRILKTLIVQRLIEIKCRLPFLERALPYNLIAQFLEFFGLDNLSEMPKLDEVNQLINLDFNLNQEVVS